MYYLSSNNIGWYFYLRFWLWFRNNRCNKYRLLCSFFLGSSHHFCILSINILTTIFVVIHILKYKHFWLLYIIIWYRPYREHPYFSIITIFTGLHICVWLAHKFYSSAVDIFSSIYNFKQMNINSIIIRLSQCGILRPMNVLVT